MNFLLYVVLEIDHLNAGLSARDEDIDNLKQTMEEKNEGKSYIILVCVCVFVSLCV